MKTKLQELQEILAEIQDKAKCLKGKKKMDGAKVCKNNAKKKTSRANFLVEVKGFMEEPESEECECECCMECCDCCEECATEDDITYLNQRINYLSESFYSLFEGLYQFRDSQVIPKLSVSQLNKLLTMIGADGDYVVSPKIVYASNGSVSSKSFELTEKAKSAE